MTAVTVTEIAVSDLPMNLISGSPKRRALIAIRGTTGVDYTLDLTTYVPGIADIEGIMYCTDDNAIAATKPTWSTTTLTTKVAGAGEIGVIVNFS